MLYPLSYEGFRAEAIGSEVSTAPLGLSGPVVVICAGSVYRAARSLRAGGGDVCGLCLPRRSVSPGRWW